MLKDIKQRIRRLGFISIELVILGSIVLAGGFIGVNKLMKNSTGVINALDDASYEQFKATKSELTIKIIGRNHVNYLYDVGEENLTDNDIVQINGVDCYVLRVEDDKAELITKNIYEANFDDGGHSAESVEGYVGVNEGYLDTTYNYKYSTLKLWMDNFYRTELGSDKRILLTDVAYYYAKDYPQTPDFDNYSKGIVQQYVFAIDAMEAGQYCNKFKVISGTNTKNYFWTNGAVMRNSDNHVVGWHISYTGLLSVYFTNGLYHNSYYSYPVGARPAFWISLD